MVLVTECLAEGCIGSARRCQGDRTLRLLSELEVLYLEIMTQAILWVKMGKGLRSPSSQPPAVSRRPSVEPRTAQSMAGKC